MVKLTDGQLAESVDVWRREGSVGKAAKALGIAKSTMHSRLTSAKERGVTKQANKSDQSRIKELEKLVDKQAQQLEDLRSAKFKISKAKKTSLGKGSFTRVCIPDTHGCLVDKLAIGSALRDIESIAPSEIVMLGDHLECGGFLAQHHTLGYVAQSEYTFQEDVAACNALLDELANIAPKAKFDYLEGNHERRLESFCVTQALKNKGDAEYLRKLFSVDANISLEKRGIRWIRQGVSYDGLPLPATIKKGHCYFTHGSSTAKHAAHAHLQKFGGNVVYGHTHRADMATIRNVKSGVISAWSPGCLSVLQPLWMHTNPTDWSHGYGLQIVNPDGTFLHINVPIIDGKSYLEPLVKAIGA